MVMAAGYRRRPAPAGRGRRRGRARRPGQGVGGGGSSGAVGPAGREASASAAAAARRRDRRATSRITTPATARPPATSANLPARSARTRSRWTDSRSPSTASRTSDTARSGASVGLDGAGAGAERMEQCLPRHRTAVDSGARRRGQDAGRCPILSAMRILVTGGGRAIGAATATELTRAGHEVVATARDPVLPADLDVALRLPLDVAGTPRWRRPWPPPVTSTPWSTTPPSTPRGRSRASPRPHRDHVPDQRLRRPAGAPTAATGVAGAGFGGGRQRQLDPGPGGHATRRRPLGHEVRPRVVLRDTPLRARPLRHPGGHRRARVHLPGNEAGRSATRAIPPTHSCGTSGSTPMRSSPTRPAGRIPRWWPRPSAGPSRNRTPRCV